jgi:hypothetical protein
MIQEEDESVPLVELNCDPDGVLPSQWADLFRSYVEFTPEQKYCAEMVKLAVRDYESLLTKGHVCLDSKQEFTLEDKDYLSEFLFSDTYGAGDEHFISFRTCCKALNIEVSDLRKLLLTFGSKDDLGRVKLKPKENATGKSN